jgi:hypothetical protein
MSQIQAADLFKLALTDDPPGNVLRDMNDQYQNTIIKQANMII